MKIQINKPIIKRQIRDTKLVRHGRVFSKPELKEVGIVNIRMAKNKGVPVDLLRKNNNLRKCRAIKAYCKRYLKFEKNSRKERPTCTNIKDLMPAFISVLGSFITMH